MTDPNLRDKTLALAGVFQAAVVVTDIATKGLADSHDLETCIRSILVTDPGTTEEIYGRVDDLRTGLHGLIEHLESVKQPRQVEIARYVITLLHLQRKLSKKQEMMKTLATGIERAKEQRDMFTLLHENVLANLADLYTQTISKIPPKIMISGEGGILSNPTNANKIRAVLLAGIRSAVLWTQKGGSRWQIIFKRRQFVDQARQLLEEARPGPES